MCRADVCQVTIYVLDMLQTMIYPCRTSVTRISTDAPAIKSKAN